MAGKENDRQRNRSRRGNRKMRICFDSLQQLVPTIPNGARLNRVQLIQHVIDYIADLELILRYTQGRCRVPPPPPPPPPAAADCCRQMVGHGPPPTLEATGCRTTRLPTATRDCAPINYPLRGVQNISVDDSEDTLYISKDDLL